MIEHYAGAFPLWLAPLQVMVLPIADRHLAYAKTVSQRLIDEGFRVQVDERVEKIGFKIREAQLQKVPYMLVVGDREAADGAVAVRSRSAGDLGSQPLDAFVASARQEVERKQHPYAVAAP
jgi:threonyl-tRNA synthetase